MPDAVPSSEKLNLAGEFPAVPTAEWEEAIAKDLKGADYEKKLVWRTEEGIAVRPYYRKENLAGLENQLSWRREHSGLGNQPGRAARLPTRFAPTCCTKPAPTVSSSWVMRLPPEWNALRRLPQPNRWPTLPAK